MITLRRNPGDRVLELGGGDRPAVHPECMGGRDVNVDVRLCHDTQGRQTVDFTADFNEPLPVASDSFDAIFSHFLLEHLSWRKVPQFLSECWRIVKPGGQVVLVVPDTGAQIQWIMDNPDGWDGKNLFESASCLLYGDQDYPENSHRCYFTPVLLQNLLLAAGFTDVVHTPYGERKTDMVLQATKPVGAVTADTPTLVEAREAPIPPPVLALTPGEMFDREYFNGGGKVGGYAREGYWDYPCHEITARHIIQRRPGSVLELGCARGYVLKRLEDVGIVCFGLEVSRHCYLTRACQAVQQRDAVLSEWRLPLESIDLCFSQAFLEHVPEEHLPGLIQKMARHCRAGLHGIDTGGKDDGFDRTHCTLHGLEWWHEMFDRHAPNWPVELVDKENLEAGPIPHDYLSSGGLVKLNLGSFTTMFHRGWINIDIHDLTGWASQHGYQFARMDLRQGLPSFGTGVVDLIYSSHCLEHMTYGEGLDLLRACRRVLKPTGLLRISVPDSAILIDMYEERELQAYNELNEECGKAPTQAGKLWALLGAHRFAFYDKNTLENLLKQAGFDRVRLSHFRDDSTLHPLSRVMRKETLEMFPGISLFVDAWVE